MDGIQGQGGVEIQPGSLVWSGLLSDRTQKWNRNFKMTELSVLYENTKFFQQSKLLCVFMYLMTDSQQKFINPLTVSLKTLTCCPMVLGEQLCPHDSYTNSL